MDRRTGSRVARCLLIVIAAVSTSGPVPSLHADAVTQTSIAISRYSDLEAAVSDSETKDRIIVVNVPIVVHKSLEIPSDRTVKVTPEGRIDVQGPQLVMRGRFVAGKTAVFTGPGAVIFDETSVKEIYPQWWGAVADGKKDCYPALVAMAASVSASGGAKIVFPPGTYAVKQYKIVDGPNRNAVDDIVYRNCSHLTISGYGAVISVFGAFRRSADAERMQPGIRYFESYRNQVTPFRLAHCSNVTIEGFELNGNANTMTRDKGVSESNGNGIEIHGGNGFLLKDLHIHHFQVDGILLDGFRKGNVIEPCRSGSVVNVKSTNNARQGVSVVQAVDFTFTDCIFSDTGLTGGAYGGHAPRAGVDVEPNFMKNGSQLQAEENTGNITFLRCRFENNQGAQVLVASPWATGTVNFRECRIDAGMSEHPFAAVLAAQQGVMENCTIDTGNAYVRIGLGKPIKQKQNNILCGCTIRTTGAGIVSQDRSDASIAVIEHNKIISNLHATSSSYAMPLLQNRNCLFTGNYIFIPGNIVADKREAQAIAVVDVRESSDNIFETDLQPKHGERIAVDYGATPVVMRDQYRDTAGQPAIRPKNVDTLDGANRYTRKL